MFRNTLPSPLADHDVTEQGETGLRSHLIPLSHLALDHPEPGGGWDAYLTVRNIPVVTDDLGRKAISSADAKQLFDEQRENEARAREVAARQEQAAIEQDRVWRAGLNKGVAWYRLPAGVAPGDAMALAAAEANHQKSVQEELLEQEFGGPQTSMVYQPYPQEDEAS